MRLVRYTYCGPTYYGRDVKLYPEIGMRLVRCTYCGPTYYERDLPRDRGAPASRPGQR